MFVIVLSAAAGLVPLITSTFSTDSKPNSGLMPSILVGLAAALFALDKAFGFSSSWIRYVVAAGAITRQLSSFRVDWVELLAKSNDPPTPDQQVVFIERTKVLVAAVQEILGQETNAWAKEYQEGAAQLDKDLKAQLESLKGPALKTQGAPSVGTVEITVEDADQSDGYKFFITLTGGPTAVPQVPVSQSKIWTKSDLAEGHYQVTVTAKFNQVDKNASQALDIKGGQTTKVDLKLSQ
jgi:hypothetical protein